MRARAPRRRGRREGDDVRLATWELAADVGDRLRELRKALDWTQGDLGRELGRSRQSILHWETGRVVPPRRQLEELCRRHHWPLEMFAEGGPRPRELLLTKPEWPGRTVRADHPAGQVREASAAWRSAAGGGADIEAVGRQFGDPASWHEEELLTVLNRLEETMRAGLVGLDAAGVRELKVVALRELIRAGREKRRFLPDVFYRVLYDLESP